MPIILPLERIKITEEHKKKIGESINGIKNNTREQLREFLS